MSATSNLHSPGRQYCAAHECRDRQRDRNILLSKRLPGGSLKVVVASAPRDLRSYLLGRALYAEVREGLGFTPTPLKQKLRHAAGAVKLLAYIRPTTIIVQQRPDML